MIEIKNLSKTFKTPDGELEALKDISLTVNDGDIFGIIGMSGAGKSTLVRCINMLERPTGGTVVIDGQDLTKMNEKQLRDIRRDITMIFQSFNLLMQRNCLKNVTFPLELAGMSKADAKARAMELLDLVGLKDKAKAYPAQLSGGQKQRVAIARALATDPKVLLCDEATSALDPTTTASILNLIRTINEKTGITVIIITHQMSVVENICSHVAIIDEGVIAECGEVSEVFSHPKTQASRRLVFPEGFEASFSGDTSSVRFIRVVFNGSNATDTPLIAKMAVDEGIAANIAWASTRSIGKRAYGSMLLSVKDEGQNVERAINYLTRTEDVTAEEVSGFAEQAI